MSVARPNPAWLQLWFLVTTRASWALLSAAGGWEFGPTRHRRAEAIGLGDEAIVDLTIDRDGASHLGGVDEFTEPFRRAEAEGILFDRLCPQSCKIRRTGSSHWNYYNPAPGQEGMI